MKNSFSTVVFSFLWLLAGISPVHTQSSVDNQTEVLAFAEFIDLVKKEHPVMKQAELLLREADAVKKMARGGFDPKLQADFDEKDFDEKDYYRRLSSKVVVPTWYGIELNAGYERNDGLFLNPENNVPTRGLWNAGISFPLGKGLVIDERRAALKQADIFQSLSENQRIIATNNLLLDASQSYADWQLSQKKVEIAQQGIEYASARYVATVSSFKNGYKPAIDTLEAFLSLQSRIQDLNKYNQELIKSRNILNTFLWQDGVTPLIIREEIVPTSLDQDQLLETWLSLTTNQNSFLVNHPELEKFRFKINDLSIEEKLTREDLKPDLRLDYNPLISTSEDAIFVSPTLNDFKWGIRFSYPLLQRKARGKIAQLIVKQENEQLALRDKEYEITQSLDIYLRNIENSRSQVSLYESMIENYRRLLQAENRRLEIGESSIFLVNTREIKFLDAQYQQADTINKLISNYLLYMYYTGDFYQLEF